MNSIFDIITSGQIAVYWNQLLQHEAPYVLEELFPNEKQLDVTLKFIKGSQGLPIALKASAFDAKAIPRNRVGFEKISGDMPLFKESLYVDEEMRQELNKVLATGNQNYIDLVMNKIFDDEFRLLRGSRARREALRAMALTTGTISLVSNGQAYTFDYGMPADHKIDAVTSWADTANSDPVKDIQIAKDKIVDDTGVTITRGICNTQTWNNLRNNEKIKKTLFVWAGGQVRISDTKLAEFLYEELQIVIRVYDKKYLATEAANSGTKFIPDDTMILFGDGPLGATVFGTTPEESDLLSQQDTDVTIVDTGVAITTIKHSDPVNVETKVSMITLPSFPAVDSVAIIDCNP